MSSERLLAPIVSAEALELSRYVESAARDSRDGCDEECQKEIASLRAELQCTHEEALKAGKALMEKLS